MFRLRAAEPRDIPQLARLAQALNTVNLPADAAALEALVDHSQRAFAERNRVRPQAPEHERWTRAETIDPDQPDPPGHFVFVLEHASAGVIGTSMLIAEHGTPADPHHSLRLGVDERYSPALARVMRHRTLTLQRSLTPHTEIGGLILDPAWRGHSARLGRALSFVRLLFLFQHRARFCDEVQAELLPPFEPDGSSRLWTWLGEPFTGLTYAEADRRSRSDRQFITALLPSAPLYLTLMPPDVRAWIGAVGPQTQGVARILEEIGFRFNGHLDPFDGGPHFACATDAITLGDAVERRIPQATAPQSDGLPEATGDLVLVTPESSHAHWTAYIGRLQGTTHVAVPTWPDAPPPLANQKFCLTLPLRTTRRTGERSPQP